MFTLRETLLYLIVWWESEASRPSRQAVNTLHTNKPSSKNTDEIRVPSHTGCDATFSLMEKEKKKKKTHFKNSHLSQTCESDSRSSCNTSCCGSTCFGCVCTPMCFYMCAPVAWRTLSSYMPRSHTVRWNHFTIHTADKLWCRLAAEIYSSHLLKRTDEAQHTGSRQEWYSVWM